MTNYFYDKTNLITHRLLRLVPFLKRSLAWFVSFIFMCWLYFQYLDNDTVDRNTHNKTIAIWLGASNVLIQIGCYYWITRRLIPAAVVQKWIKFFLFLLAMAIFVSLSRHYIQLIIGQHFTGYNRRLDSRISLYNGYSPIEILVNLMHFFDDWIYVYSILLVPVCIRVVKEIYIVRTHSLQLELNLLRSQINPHFVFNTLNNIYSIVEASDTYAADIISKFSHILHYTFYDTEKDYITLLQEVEAMNALVELEKIRHDHDVELTLTIAAHESDMSFAVPPLLLVSLVENAFKHGVNASINASWVRITLTTSNSLLQFNVTNSKPKSTSLIEKKTVSSHHVGLTNIRRRLELLFPDRHQLLITESVDTYSVRLLLTHHGKINNVPNR